MIFDIVQNFPIQTFNCHCYAIKTGLEYITYQVFITLTVKKDFPAQSNGETQTNDVLNQLVSVVTYSSGYSLSVNAICPSISVFNAHRPIERQTYIGPLNGERARVLAQLASRETR